MFVIPFHFLFERRYVPYVYTPVCISVIAPLSFKRYAD